MTRFTLWSLTLAAAMLPGPAVNLAAQAGSPPASSSQEAAATLETITPPIRTGDVEKVRALLDQNPRLVNAQDPVGRAPLHVAAAADQPAVVALLLERGAAIDARTAEGETPLAVAAARGAARAARRLLEAGAAVDVANTYGRTPLLLAARESGSADIARALLDRKAAIDARDKFGDTPLTLAAWKGYREVVDVLLDRGAAVPGPGPAAVRLLESAAEAGLANLFGRLAAAGADVSGRTDRGGTMLHLAAAGGSAGIVRELLAKQFGVNDADRDGWTPLHNAAFMGRRDVVEALVAAGADLQARTVLGQSAWNLATEHGLSDIAQWLADKGAGREAPRFPALGGAYLGQTPPGAVPAEFAPGIVGGHFSVHSSVTFSPDGREVYWSESIPPRGSGNSTGRTMVSKRVGDRWTYPERAMVGRLPLEDVPVITADGARIYDMARRPLAGQAGAGKENIWVAERTGDRWGDPRPLDQTVNALPHHWQFAVGQDGAVYFSSSWKGARGLFVSRPIGGRYPEPLPLGAPFPTSGNDAMPFLAGDGSYLLFQRNYDIYVSFRGATGAWMEPVALPAPINTRDMELCPTVSPDGRYLFFMRGGRVYWVDAGVIRNLRASASGQAQALRPITADLGQLADGKGAQVHNRALTVGAEDGRSVARLDARAGDGGVLIDGIQMSDGIIDVDLKGKDVAQQSFLGIAFHVVDWTTLDAVYFRPFNFRGADAERRSHSVQYVAHPAHTWQRLRAERPGQFEAAIDPPPDPNAWFHARIVVAGGRVEVFVNDAAKPALSVEDLGPAKSGGVALFVGNGSDGAFANLRITPTAPPGPVPASTQTIFQASATGNLPRLRLLVDADPKAVAARNPGGLTALHAAALYGQQAAAEYLVSKGADLSAVARHSGTPMDVAFEAKQHAMVAWLESRGARFTPLTFDVTTITPRVRRIAFPWGMMNNVLAYAGADGAVVVDSGFSARAIDALKTTIAAGSKTGVRWLISTHGHGDHIAGNALAPSPEAVISAATLSAAAPGPPITRGTEPLKGRTGRTLPAPYTLRTGGADIRIIHRPGLHSDADVIVWFPAESVVAMGDLLLSQTIPAVDDIAGYLAFLDDVLDVFPEKTVFVSGHGRDLDAAGVRAYRDALLEMIAIVRTNLAAGRTPEQMVKDDVLKAYKARFGLLDFLPVDALIPRAVAAIRQETPK